VSQKIMHEHDGDIVVESTPELGSRFILQIPAVIPTAPPSAEDAPARLTLDRPTERGD
jgi:hypothetical protein